MSIKVLHLIDSGGLYGAEAVLLNLVEEQVKSGLTPLILSAGTPDIDEKPLEKAALERGLPLKKWRMKAGFNLPEAWKILKFAKEEGIQVLHSHGYKFNLLMGIWPKSIRKIPLITTVHGYVVAKPYTKMWLYQLLDRNMLGKTDATVFVSSAMLKQPFFKDLMIPQALVINNGMNIDHEQRKMLGDCDSEFERIIEDAYPIVGAVGRLAVEKGYEYLIEAFNGVLEEFPNAKLVIIGEGYHREALVDLAKQSNISSKISLLGFRNPIYPYLAKFDIFVMPSVTEGLPIGLLEAMLVNVPIVASAVGGIPEALAYGAAGTLVAPRSSKCIQEAILTCLREKDWAEEKANLALQQVRENYTSMVMEERYRLVYQNIVFKS